MKSSAVFALLVVRFVNSIPFVIRNYLPGRFQPRSCIWKLRRGGSKSNTIVVDNTDDYERAEKAILKSVEKIEAIVEKVVADEVDILFHKDHPEKEKITSNARKAVATGVDKVKSTIKGHSEKISYPFEMKSQTQPKNPMVHKDHRVLHAIEAAERAVLQAIYNEVDTLFHETAHDKKSKSPNHPTVQQKAKVTVKDGVMKASTVVDNIHSHRRDWLLNVSTSMIEDYSLPEFFLE
jgi:hypothetical protein